MDDALATWLAFSLEKRAKDVAWQVGEELPSDWATADVLMEHLFEIHPEVDQVRRVFVDISDVNFTAPERLENFYATRGHNWRMERNAARELRELRSGAYDPEDQPDLGQDIEYEIDLARSIQARACDDLARGTESAEHEEMLARGATFATLHEYRINTYCRRRAVMIVLTHIVLSTGEEFFALPWEQEDGGLAAIPGEWVEVDAEAAEQASVEQMLSEAKQAHDAEDEQTIEQAMRAVWGDDFSLPEVVDEVIDEADKWKEQLREEFGDDSEAAEEEQEQRPEQPEDLPSVEDKDSPGWDL